MTKRKAPDDRCPDNYRTPHAMSDAEIAAVLGVSRQRVMFIASRAMRKVRAEFERRGIRGADVFDDLEEHA